jgi:hypothetical protein
MNWTSPALNLKSQSKPQSGEGRETWRRVEALRDEFTDIARMTRDEIRDSE